MYGQKTKKFYRAVFEIQIFSFNTKFRKIAKFRMHAVMLPKIRKNYMLFSRSHRTLWQIFEFFQAVFTENEPPKVVNRDSLSPALSTNLMR